MEPREAEIDRLLRRSMAAPVPSLTQDFDRRLMRRVRRSSESLDRYRQIMFAGYVLISVLVSVVIMRSQGLGWGPIAGLVLAPLVVVAATRSTRRTTVVTVRHGQQ
jgi:hypothetical protein